MDLSSDDSSFQSSNDGPGPVIINDPEIQKPYVEIDFSEMAVIESNLKDVHSRLTDVQKLLGHSGYGLHFVENEIETIQLKVKQIIFQLENKALERQVCAKMGECLKEYADKHLPALITSRMGNLNLLIREKMTKCLKEKDLNDHILENALRSEKVELLIREKMIKLLREFKEKKASNAEQVASKVKTEEKS